MTSMLWDMRNRSLRGADLTQRDWGHTDFSGSDLSHARMAGGCFSGSFFNGAILEEVQAEGADFSFCKMQNARLDRAFFYCARLEYADLSGVSAQEAVFEGANANCLLADNADFTGASFKSPEEEEGPAEEEETLTSLRRSVFRSTCFKGANLRNLVAAYAHFINCDFSRADLSSIDATGANFSGSRFHKTYLAYAILEDTVGPFSVGSFGRTTGIASGGDALIGGETHSVGYWLEHGPGIWKAEGWTDEEIARYLAWLRIVGPWLGMGEE